MTSLINTFSDLDFKKSNTNGNKSKRNSKPKKYDGLGFDCIIVESVEDLGEYIRIDYDENKNCIRLFRDWKCWKYKNLCKKEKKKLDKTDKVFNYYFEKNSCHLHEIFNDKKKLLSFESGIVEKLKLKDKNIRLSKNYLNATFKNALTINLLDDYQISKIQESFIKKKDEDVSKVFGIPIDKNFYFRKIRKMLKDTYGEKVELGHHLKVAITNFNYGKKNSWKRKVNYNNMNLLVILEEYPDGKKEVNIPGGKRELGESSLEAGIRETNEEVIDRLIDPDTKPIYSFQHNEVDVFVFNSIDFLKGEIDKKLSSQSELSDKEFLKRFKSLCIKK